ncbi:leucyl/phenylalanyl-tRNA--protein transferase [Novosphingobium sp. 9]|uniref:leucyl/phenylalanyl-tRNA--protein transferase n=1 Tax=Novosphingobium sp. 9 TaxID=2025349 RepID=UPI0021B62703|nr:leucyl/phenylalanyl-tRNA--protein transferase [Novosphingobium sp. 9]
MLAYRTGIFPMADARDDPEIFWVEPRLRAIIPLDGFRLSRSLARTLRRERFTVTCNAAFDQVITACAAPRPDPEATDSESGSWISHRIQASYQRLHDMGLAHSIECWQRDENGEHALVGGLYGVGFNRAFCGESMFSRVPDASKVALAWLVAALRKADAQLLDCQFMTSHLASLGAVEIPQKRYLALLNEAQSSAGAVDVPTGATEGAATAAAFAAGASSGAAALSLPEGFGALLALAGAGDPASSPGKCISHFLTHTS